MTALYIILGILLAFFLLKIFVHKLFFDVLILLFTVIGTYEMIRAFGDKLHKSQKIVAMTFAILVVATYIAADMVFTDVLGVQLPDPENPMAAVGRNYAPHITLIMFIAGIAVAFGLLVFAHTRVSLESVGYTLVAYLYPSVFLVIMTVCNHLAYYSDAAIAMVFVISPAADCLAYTFGKSLGKKFPAKMAPHVSPNKTLIGGFGGLVGGAIGAAANLILLSLHGEMLTAFRGKMNNDYKEIVFSVPVAEITDVVVKNGLFGLQKKVKFKAAGVGQKILMAYSEKKLIAFFKELAAAH